VKWQLLVALLVFGFSFTSSAADTAEPVAVDEICGKLVSIGNATEKGTANSAKEGVKPFEHAHVSLFFAHHERGLLCVDDTRCRGYD